MVENIEAVIEFMRANIARRVTLDQLAEIAGVSKFHFVRIFKAHTGESPFQFLTRLRMAEAARLLAEGASIKRAMFDVSYPYHSRKTFYRHFRRSFDCTPKQFVRRIPESDAARGSQVTL